MPRPLFPQFKRDAIWPSAHKVLGFFFRYRSGTSHHRQGRICPDKTATHSVLGQHMSEMTAAWPNVDENAGTLHGRRRRKRRLYCDRAGQGHTSIGLSRASPSETISQETS